jgi:leader peptidase (prepilin peptidase) / N-methyltransferase
MRIIMTLAPWMYGLLGLVIGSFLNVCIYRLPRSESIVFPGSHCPNCAKAIAPYDNIPVLSFLWLLGRCRHCGTPISFQYPLVELLAGSAFYFSAMRWGLTAPAFIGSLFLSALIVLFFVDFHHQILPNSITLPGTLVGILLSPFQFQDFYQDAVTLRLTAWIAPNSTPALWPWIGSVFGVLVGGGLLFLVGFVFQVVRKKQGLGMGDVKMMSMVGAFLGWRLALFTIFAGSLLGSFLGIFLILFFGKSLQTKLAFGTFLSLGATAALFWGLPLIQWYSHI